MGQIRDRLELLWARQRDLAAEVEKIQATCPHDEYREGISMVARVHEVLLCKECNHVKAIDYPRLNSVMPAWRIDPCVDKQI